MKMLTPSNSPAAIAPERVAWLLRSATLASVVTAAILIVAKALAWWLSGSVSLLASLADSSLDALAALLNMMAVHYALQPADDDHRFGHGKAEFLAGLGQAVLIGSSAIFLCVQAVDRLLHPQPLQELGVSIAVMSFSIVATSILLMWQRHVIRQTHSVAIRADSLHYASDLLSNAAVIVALGLAQFGWLFFDPVFAIGIAVMIAWSAVSIGIESVDYLLDRELPEEVKTQIESLARSHEGVLGLHGLRTRQSGHTKVIQLHLEMDGSMPLREAHNLAERVERAISEAFPGADVIIHQDPWEPR